VRLVGIALLFVACSARDDEAWKRIAAIAGTAPATDCASARLKAAASYGLDGAQRIAEIEAWAEAGGQVIDFDPLNDPDHLYDAFVVGIRIAKDHADDDRALEAALYLGQQLRGCGPLTNGMIGFAIARFAAEYRSQPPPFAARYAPTDAEVFRMFAGEAMWMRTSPAGDRDEAEKQWRWLASAPRDRLGFTGALSAQTFMQAVWPFTYEYADKAYDAVDEYQRWLAR